MEGAAEVSGACSPGPRDRQPAVCWTPTGHPVLSLSVGIRLHLLSSRSSAAAVPPDAGSVEAAGLPTQVCGSQLQKGRGCWGRQWTQGPESLGKS